MFVTVCQQRTSTVQKKRGTCGIAVQYRKGNGTGTAQKWYRSAAQLYSVYNARTNELCTNLINS